MMRASKYVPEEPYYAICIKKVILKQDTNIISLDSSKVIQFILSYIYDKTPQCSLEYAH